MFTFKKSNNKNEIQMKNFKKGDKVLMFGCMESDLEKNKGKVWQCSCDSYFNEYSKQEVVFLKGYSGYFSCDYLQIVNVKSIEDRFFLEEIVHRLKEGQFDYVKTLCKDWLKEFREEIPLTENQRSLFISKNLGDELIDQGYYFKKESELESYLS